MRAHIIKNGEVSNTIEVKSLTLAQELYPDLLIIEATIGGIGWSYDGANLTPPPEPVLTLAKLKKIKLRALRAKQRAVLAGGRSYTFPDGVGTVDTSEADVLNLTAISTRASQGEHTFRWRDRENVIHAMMSAEALLLTASVFDWQQTVRVHAWALRDQLVAATTRIQLRAIDIDGGWPT